MPKVSVIIPCYNAGNYISRCIDSLLCQTMSDFEIICVDDGSTDETPVILKAYAGNDSRVKVLEQKNLYAGVARNNGFSVSQGRYVIFLDADDFFEENTLEIMLGKITEDNADICICDGYKFFTDTDKSLLTDEFVKFGSIPENLPFNKNDIPDKIFNIGANVPWNKMFRAAFIRENNLKFQNLRKANDTYFVLMAIFLAERITCVKDRLIHYRCDSEGSITSGKVTLPPCAFESYSFLKDELEKREDYSEENRRSFINRAARGMLRILHLPMSETDYEAVRAFLKERGLSELGIVCEEKLYDSRWVYEDIHSVLNNTGTEHMIYKFNSAKVSKDKIKSRSLKLKQQLEKEKAKKEKLDKKLTETKVRLSDSKQKLKEKEKELAKVQKEKAAMEKSFMALRSKWYVRLFVKLENVFKKSGKKKKR